MALTFSNPRLHAEFNDWPLGGNKRGQCVFQVESHPKKGQRVSRITTGKPKFSTYSPKMAIADGSDGRTYILRFNNNAVHVQRSDFMDAAEEMERRSSYIFQDLNATPEDLQIYNEIKNLIEQANSQPVS